MPDCDSFNQQAFANDYQRFNEWRMGNVRYETEFGIVHVPLSKDAKVDWEQIEDEEQFNKRIGIKILKSRANPRPKFEPLDFKACAMRELENNPSVKDFRESNFKSFSHSNAGSLNATRRLNSTVDARDNSNKKSIPAPSMQQELTAASQKQRVTQKLH